LECLALLLGSTKTIQMAAPRLAAPDPDDLAVLAAPAPTRCLGRRRPSGVGSPGPPTHLTCPEWRG
jgi:hypothetical protein